jgi:hypothetical protein
MSLPTQRLAQLPVSQADFADLRKQSRSFASVAAIYIDKDKFGGFHGANSRQSG